MAMTKPLSEQVTYDGTTVKDELDAINAKLAVNYFGSATYDPASLASGSGVTTTVSVPGAETGDIVDVAFSTALADVQLWGWVSGPDVVSVRFHNQTGAAVDLGSGTLTVRVRKI